MTIDQSPEMAERRRCTLTDSELIEKAHEWISKLAKSGGREWCLRIPVDFNHDPDMVFSELCARLEAAGSELARIKEAASGEARGVADKIYEHYHNSMGSNPEGDPSFGAAAILAAYAERVRRECADRASEYIEGSFTDFDGSSYCYEGLRAAITGKGHTNG